VCDRFYRVLATGSSAPLYPKSTHRIVIREGLVNTPCPDRGRTLCAYLDAVSSEQFIDHPVDLLDLREAASLIVDCPRRRP
jgi:hypothetical protein